MNAFQTDNWNVIKSPWFYSVLLLFVLHQVMQFALQIRIPFIDNYLDPFLFLPVALGAYLQERRWILGNSVYTLDTFKLIGISVILCVIVEVIFPLINSGYTFDVFDFPSYAAGAVYFQYTINRL